MKKLFALLILSISIWLIGCSWSDFDADPVSAGGDPGPAVTDNAATGSVITEGAVPESAEPGLTAAVHGAGIQEPEAGLETGKVVRVVDGDTMVINIGGKDERVRLIGVDTPESVHPDESRNVPYGKVASQYTKDMLLGKAVGLEFDVQERDQYGRILAYVYIGGIMFNDLLLREGHASVSTYPPNVKYVDAFTASQREAREAGLGQWADPENLFPARESTSGSGKFIGSAGSMKFHTLACKWGKKISSRNAVYFNSPKEAMDAGYAPCKVCNP